MDWIDQFSEEWSRELPDVDSSALPPLARLARITVLIDAFQQEVLAPFDLTPGDYGVLATLRRGGAPYTLNPSQLTSRLRRSSGGMTKMLKRLEERGSIARSPDPADGRGSVVTLTTAGLVEQEQVFRAYADAARKLFDRLSSSQQQSCDRSLRQFLAIFEAHLS